MQTACFYFRNPRADINNFLWRRELFFNDEVYVIKGGVSGETVTARGKKKVLARLRCAGVRVRSDVKCV